MTEQDGRQAVVQQRPTNDQESWKAYWQAQGQPWRTEPEIDTERQHELKKQLASIPDVREEEILYFEDIQLNRADIEWLLATQKTDRIVVFTRDNEQRQRHESLTLSGADLRNINLSDLPLQRVNLLGAHLEGANLQGSHLQEAVLTRIHLEGARLIKAHLEGADLVYAHLEDTDLIEAHLEGALCCRTFFNAATRLNDVTLGNNKHSSTSFVDVRWGEVNLTVVDWTSLKMLGDDYIAQQQRHDDRETELYWYRRAVRANRQLATVLQTQGLNEEADRFAYRAQLLQRKVLWYQHEFGRWLFSMFLALLSGYGYRIWRILAAYIVMVSLFALAFFVLGIHYSPHLALDQAFLESITAFHGRVFLEQFSPNTPQIWLTALEAIAGLIIEGVFIAMLIQRFFGK
jgi:hypothetical protein